MRLLNGGEHLPFDQLAGEEAFYEIEMNFREIEIFRNAVREIGKVFTDGEIGGIMNSSRGRLDELELSLTDILHKLS